MRRLMILLCLAAGCGNDQPAVTHGQIVPVAMDPNRPVPPRPGPNELSRTNPRAPRRLPSN